MNNNDRRKNSSGGRRGTSGGLRTKGYIMRNFNYCSTSGLLLFL